MVGVSGHFSRAGCSASKTPFVPSRRLRRIEEPDRRRIPRYAPSSLLGTNGVCSGHNSGTPSTLFRRAGTNDCPLQREQNSVRPESPLAAYRGAGSPSDPSIRAFVATRDERGLLGPQQRHAFNVVSTRWYQRLPAAARAKLRSSRVAACGGARDRIAVGSLDTRLRRYSGRTGFARTATAARLQRCFDALVPTTARCGWNKTPFVPSRRLRRIEGPDRRRIPRYATSSLLGTNGVCSGHNSGTPSTLFRRAGTNDCPLRLEQNSARPE